MRVGISACLLGQEVRFDGGHKRDSFLIDELGKYVEWVPVCPEVEVGMGTPREPLRLVRDGRHTRMIATHTGIDYTDRMNRWARQQVAALAREDLDGYVLKSKSPSCGMLEVSIFNHSGQMLSDGRGRFAAVLLETFPMLPTEEDGRLHDSQLRRRFLERLLEYRRSKDHHV
jgi:uncharacterized protein YbbK (DUF523 family)